MSSSLPLRHATVLDLTDEAGAQGARLLAELGARVIRVEASTGDGLRRRPPFLDGEPGIERSLAHLLYNAGKESVALALDVAGAWDLVDRLAVHTDLVLAPLEKSALARRFFDERRLRSVHSTLGVVDVVFRREPLVEQESVTDLIGVAAGGLLYVNGFPDVPPDLPFGRLAYRQASFTIAGTAAALLLNRRRFGRGGIVSISLQEAVAMTTMQAANENLWRWQGAIAVRSGLEGLSYPVLGKDGQTALIRTSRTTYSTRDGKWVSFSLWPAAWSGFAAWVAEVTGSDALLQPAWDDPLYRAQHRQETDDAIVALCAALPRDELVRTAQRIGLLVLPINDAGDVARDEHLHQRGFYQDVEQPALGRVLRMPGSVFTSSAWGRPRLGPAPALGQHTAAVLEELCGLGRADLSWLGEDRLVDRSTTETREAVRV